MRKYFRRKVENFFVEFFYFWFIMQGVGWEDKYTLEDGNLNGCGVAVVVGRYVWYAWLANVEMNSLHALYIYA